MIPRRGSRTITVRNLRFRWAIRRKPTYAQAVAMTRLNLVVVLADARGSRLVARLQHAHPGNFAGKEPVSVTPAEVARCVERALDAGWRPEMPGPVFELSC